MNIENNSIIDLQSKQLKFMPKPYFYQSNSKLLISFDSSMSCTPSRDVCILANVSHLSFSSSYSTTFLDRYPPKLRKKKSHYKILHRFYLSIIKR